ncbi:hypothetical protein [Xylocopilactobacillus apis]|uniref:Uncharacterized protein n=1 Tax=Xylocopilactobacillus apis TaxID=2932183 RepID=A0AAU9DAB7_9LACO|nr:hypothetical protein [Xylocopilactobacillus apis]BDR56595.1 hypothetical protein KIMC2_11570 [Xylocopilactobacillus apis]
MRKFSRNYLSKQILREIGINQPERKEFDVLIREKENEIVLKKKDTSRLMANYGNIARYQPKIGDRELNFDESFGREII